MFEVVVWVKSNFIVFFTLVGFGLFQRVEMNVLRGAKGCLKVKEQFKRRFDGINGLDSYRTENEISEASSSRHVSLHLT